MNVYIFIYIFIKFDFNNLILNFYLLKFNIYDFNI